VSRFQRTFDTAASPRLVAYVTAGDPDLETSRRVVRAIAEAGADIIEIGVPFSDPIGDGPAIQRASERALAAGASLETALDLVAAVRPDLSQPLVLFTYVNPVMRLGVERFVARAAEAGVDGVLFLDLPIEESASMHAALDSRGLDQVFLVSPTTTEVRLRAAARYGRGFLYAISRLGVTGARDVVSDAAGPLVGRIRALTTLPVAVGFGIARPDHVRAVTAFADAAVVGSALVNVIAEAARGGKDPAAEAGRFVRWLKGPGD
jgi:tryptophan synthase alpha chain